MAQKLTKFPYIALSIIENPFIILYKGYIDYDYTVTTNFFQEVDDTPSALSALRHELGCLPIWARHAPQWKINLMPNILRIGSNPQIYSFEYNTPIDMFRIW